MSSRVLTLWPDSYGADNKCEHHRGRESALSQIHKIVSVRFYRETKRAGNSIRPVFHNVSGPTLPDVCARRVRFAASSYFLTDVLYFVANATSQFRTARWCKQQSRRDSNADAGGETHDISNGVAFVRIDHPPCVPGEFRGPVRSAIHTVGCLIHGYIFSGHRGIGKTTVARILAAALNCRSTDHPVPEPCGICESCTEIRAGNAVDVIEIDAATNRGIDEIRELREAARYRPARDRFKIYILDEAHQITDAAFNALLKTLEEPPDHIVFMREVLDSSDSIRLPFS